MIAVDKEELFNEISDIEKGVVEKHVLGGAVNVIQAEAELRILLNIKKRINQLKEFWL